MTATVDTRFGWQVSSTGAEYLYTVFDETSPTAAHAAALAEAPASVTVNGKTAKLSNVSVDEVGNGVWHATASYALPESGKVEREADTTAFNFQTSGGTQHITQSRGTTKYYDSAMVPSAPEYKGAIGVSESGVDGVDITVPVMSFNITAYRATCDSTYIAALFGLTGRTNVASFTVTTDDGASLTFAAGEVLYLGAAGGKRGDQPWEINHAFAASPNVTGLSVGDITGIEKLGWQYLWARYKQREDSTAKMLVQKPIAAYVETVYLAGDFDGLDL